MTKKTQDRTPEALRQTRGFIRQLIDSKGEFSSSDPFVFSHRGKSCSLNESQYNLYRECVDGLEKAFYPDGTMSRRAIEDCLQRAILDAELGDGADADDRIQKASDELKSALSAVAVPAEVYIPIDGVDAGSLPFILGNVVLRPGVDTEKNIKCICPPLDGSSDVIGDEGLCIVAEEFKMSAVAVMSVLAVDSDAALDISMRSVRQVADILNFFSDSLVPDYYGAVVAIKVERIRRTSMRTLVHHHEAQRWAIKSYAVGSRKPLALPDINSERARE